MDVEWVQVSLRVFQSTSRNLRNLDTLVCIHSHFRMLVE
jgi:hypothetical protein